MAAATRRRAATTDSPESSRDSPTRVSHTLPLSLLAPLPPCSPIILSSLLTAGYDSSAIAGYANAAAIQQQQLRSQQQGGAPQQGYYGNAAGLPAGYGAPGGGGYGMYPQGGPAEGGNGQDQGRNGADVSAASAGYAAAAEQQQAAQQNGQYGAYRGQGAAQGRVDRSYRPY